MLGGHWVVGQLGLTPPYGIGNLAAFFGHPVPTFLRPRLPGWLNIGLIFLQLGLVFNRVAQMAKARSLAPPPTYKGLVAVAISIAIASVGLGLVVLLASIALHAGSGVPAGMLLLPAIVLLPYAWLWVEVNALRVQRAAA